MIKLKNITKKYENRELPALDMVSLDIQDGEYISIMEKSGSGKSTLLNIIGTMDYATDGEYYYNDIAVHELSKKETHAFRREHVGFVFQNYSLMRQYTVYENVELPLIARNVPKKERKKIIHEMLEFVGISDLENKKTTQISGGEQQRCAIARLMALGGDIILADEPTGALDYDTGMAIMELLENINKQGKTLIVITHDREIGSRADRTIWLADGKIVEETK